MDLKERESGGVHWIFQTGALSFGVHLEHDNGTSYFMQGKRIAPWLGDC
jgi:hypothetical protein